MSRRSFRELLLVTALVGVVVGLWIWRLHAAIVNEAPARQEQAKAANERYERLPILGPLASAGAVAFDPPSDDEVILAWEKDTAVQGGLPFLHKAERKNVRIVKEKIANYIDPPRVVPLIGPVQLHHANYKCTIYCTEVTRARWPIPHTEEADCQEVVFIDHNHFHLVEEVSSVVPISSVPASH